MKAVFGLDMAKFNELARKMAGEHFKELARRKGRQRAPGAGQKSKIDSGEHKLAFILFYLKVYPTFDVMSVFSGINAGDCCRWMHRLLPVLERLLGQKLVLPKRKIDTIEAFMEAFPDAKEVIIDGMERPVQRAKKKRRSASTTLVKRRGIHEKRLLLWMENAA